MDNKRRYKRVPAPRHRRVKSKSKIGLLAFALVMLATVSVVTVAFLIDKTEPVSNTFTPAFVACEVQEESFDGNVKTNVTVKNTGEVESYIRAKIVVTWMSSDGTKVTPKTPQEGTDYSMTFASNTDWELGADGFWYYRSPVNVSDSTKVLIEECTVVEGAAPDGFYLSVDILGQAIQSKPTDAVLEKWDSGVVRVADGKLVLKAGGAE